MRSGDPCDKCATGRLLSYRTVRVKDGVSAVRYLRCTNHPGCDGRGIQALLSRDLRPRRKKRAGLPCKVTSPRDSHDSNATMEDRTPTRCTREATPKMTRLNEFLIGMRTTAKRTEVDLSRLLGMIESGAIPAPRIVDGMARWAPSDLEEWVANGSLPCEPPDFRLMHKIRRGWIEESHAKVEAGMRRIEALMELREEKL